MVQIRRAILWQLAGLAVAAGAIFLLSRIVPVIDTLAEVQQHVMRWGAWSAIWYPLLYACCNVLLLPGGVLSVGAGFFFGLWWGFFLVWFGTVLGAAAAFGISRALGRQWVEKHLFKHRKLAALDEAISREGWKIIVLSQLHPLFPTSLIFYLYGVTRMRFWNCMLWIAVGQAPGRFLYSYFGTLAQYGIRLLQHKSHPRPVEYIVWGGGLLLTFGITFALGRIALRLLREVSDKDATGNAAPITDAESASE